MEESELYNKKQSQKGKMMNSDDLNAVLNDLTQRKDEFTFKARSKNFFNQVSK